MRYDGDLWEENKGASMLTIVIILENMKQKCEMC